VTSETEWEPTLPIPETITPASSNGTVPPAPAPPPKPDPPKPPVFDCGTCGDKGQVAIIFESFTGPQRKALPCPDCGGSPLKFASARDEALRKLDDRVKTLARSIAILVALAAIAYLLSRKNASELASAIGEEVTS
jgi:hypothetical protein